MKTVNTTKILKLLQEVLGDKNRHIVEHYIERPSVPSYSKNDTFYDKWKWIQKHKTYRFLEDEDIQPFVPKINALEGLELFLFMDVLHMFFYSAFERHFGYVWSYEDLEDDLWASMRNLLEGPNKQN